MIKSSMMRLKIIIISLLFFNNGYSQGSAHADFNYTGSYQLISKYKSDMGKIEIEQIARDTLKFYLNVIRTSNGSVAETYGTFAINGDKGIFHNQVYGAENCTLTFYFKSDTLYLNQDGTNNNCRFGLNAGVDGKYEKLSGSKPLFKDLKRIEANSKRLNIKYNQDQLARNIVVDQYKSHPVRISFDNNYNDSLGNASISMYDRILNNVFRDSLRLSEVARGLWYTQKKVSRTNIIKSRKDFVDKDKFISFPKHWIALSNDNMDSTCLHFTEGGIKPSIEVTDSVIIINGPKYTYAWYLVNMVKTPDDQYVFSCLGWPGVLPDSIRVGIMNPDTRLSMVTYITHVNNERISYHWYMLPIESLPKYPICTQLGEDEKGSVGNTK